MATELARSRVRSRVGARPLRALPWLRQLAVLLVAAVALAASVEPAGVGAPPAGAPPAVQSPSPEGRPELGGAGHLLADPGRFGRPPLAAVLRDGRPGEPAIPEPLHLLVTEPERFLPPPDPNPPVQVRGIYVTGWVAGLAQRFEQLRQLVLRTELNAMVIDVKDDTGYLTYRSGTPEVAAYGSGSARIPDLPALVARLNADGIYPIARLVLFKDPLLVRLRPDLAIGRVGGGVWRDRRGTAWTDPHLKEVWDYNLAIAREVAAMGFREIQFDYVRFPTDGDRSTIVYRGADGRTMAEVIRDFLAYASAELKPLGVYVSADIFGLVTTVQDDMGIGQHLETLAPVVDYLCPMVYPSHYAPGSYGMANPDARPYETVYNSMSGAARRLGDEAPKLRAWLQDFSLGHRYGPEEVRAQIQAVYDAGLTEWILWSPSNVYSTGALEPAGGPAAAPAGPSGDGG